MKMDGQFEIIVELTFREFLKSNYRVFLKKTRLLLFLCAAVPVLTFIVNTRYVYSANIWFPVLFAVLLFLMVYMGAKRAWVLKPQYGERTVYAFTDKSLRMESKSIKAEYDWSNFIRFESAHTDFYLFITEQQIMIFPFGAFADPAQIQQLREFVSKKINTKAEEDAKKLRAKNRLIIFTVWLIIIIAVFIFMFFLDKPAP
jgi:hypothetical protein